MKQFPKEELYGLSSQIKRSAVSIPSNIAEGCGRHSNQQLIYYLQVAKGSCYELETQIIISIELSFIKESPGEKLLVQIEQIAKMINGLIRKIEKV